MYDVYNIVIIVLYIHNSTYIHNLYYLIRMYIYIFVLYSFNPHADVNVNLKMKSIIFV